MSSVDFFAATTDDGRALLAAAESDWSRPVPHCPDWDLAALVGHTGGIFAWMARIVTTGQPVARADREVPPVDFAERTAWYLAYLEQVLEVLSQRAPDAPAWTFSSRDVTTVGWWRRRLAVETAIHRWDAEYAIGGDASDVRPLDSEVATAGIEEFVDEFLPGLVAQPTVTGFSGVLELSASDSERAWKIDLGALCDASTTSDMPTAPTAPAVVRGTRSDLLLWLTNREPTPFLEVTSRDDLTSHWHQLRR